MLYAGKEIPNKNNDDTTWRKKRGKKIPAPSGNECRTSASASTVLSQIKSECTTTLRCRYSGPEIQSQLVQGSSVCILSPLLSCHCSNWGLTTMIYLSLVFNSEVGKANNFTVNSLIKYRFTNPHKRRTFLMQSNCNNLSSKNV